MLPPLLREIASGPDPDRALNRLADIVERLSSGINLYRLLEARPQLARHVALILAYAAPLADMLARRPDLLDGLIDEFELRASARASGNGRTAARRHVRGALRPGARPRAGG